MTLTEGTTEGSAASKRGHPGRPAAMDAQTQVRCSHAHRPRIVPRLQPEGHATFDH